MPKDPRRLSDWLSSFRHVGLKIKEKKNLQDRFPTVHAIMASFRLWSFTELLFSKTRRTKIKRKKKHRTGALRPMPWWRLSDFEVTDIMSDSHVTKIIFYWKKKNLLDRCPTVVVPMASFRLTLKFQTQSLTCRTKNKRKKSSGQVPYGPWRLSDWRSTKAGLTGRDRRLFSS